MNVATLGRSLPASALRRWRDFRFRAKAGLAVLATALALCAWVAIREAKDPWPARAVLKTARDTMPLTFSPDGKTFLSSGEGGITPWDTSTGRKGTPWASKAGWHVVEGTYSPDGRTFAAAIFDHPHLATIELIDPSTGRTRATLATQQRSVHRFFFTPDGRAIRAYLGDGTNLKEVATWDASTGEQTSSRALSPPTRGSYMAISPDGRTLALANAVTGIAQLWDLEADRSLGTLVKPGRTGFYMACVAFSPDGLTLALSREDGAIELWDVPGRKPLRTLPGHWEGEASGHLRFAPDGRTLVSTGNQEGSRSTLDQARDAVQRNLIGTTKRSASHSIMIDVATGRRIARVPSAMFPMFSPDGRTFATREEDLGVRLRDFLPPSK